MSIKGLPIVVGDDAADRRLPRPPKADQDDAFGARAHVVAALIRSAAPATAGEEEAELRGGLRGVDGVAGDHVEAALRAPRDTSGVASGR